MANIGATQYGLLPQGLHGRPNEGSWNTTLTDVSTTHKHVPGITRSEGGNTYVYVQFGTGALNSAGLPLTIASSATDANGYVPPFAVTAFAGTGSNVFMSVYGVTIQTGTGVSGTRYGWVCIAGIGTLPAGDVAAGFAQGTPLIPSSSSAGFFWNTAAAASSVGRAWAAGGVTVGTATMSVAGGVVAKFDFTKTFG